MAGITVTTTDGAWISLNRRVEELEKRLDREQPQQVDVRPLPEDPGYMIGSKLWPGLSKLIEESGEVQQIIGKLIATSGSPVHWDGSNLHACLQDEIADLMAACQFVAEANKLDQDRIRARLAYKLGLFHSWHKSQQTPTSRSEALRPPKSEAE